MKSKSDEKRIIILLSLAVVFALTFLVYYSINSNIKNYKYTDNYEYSNVDDGLKFIRKLPIYFNITNQAFRSFDSLKQEYKESILLSYHLKNDLVNNCDDNEDEVCIPISDLKEDKVLAKFASKTNFKSEKINVYIDDYGSNVLYKDKDIYRGTLKENNKYETYTSFNYFKKTRDEYNFYVYQGYYFLNKDNKYELHDFLSDEKVYEEDINESSDLFENITEKQIQKLQVYKYILKKDKNDKFYLYGYNPVK